LHRVAIYARYSSERQNERSIADQLSVCVRHAAAKGWSVVETYSDAANSGAAMANRPGLLDALAAAEAGAFDVLLTEDEDRIARNLEHLAHVASRLRFAGVTLATLSTDAVEDMHVAFKGLIGAEYLKNLSQKTKRGMRSNAEKGLATGSRLYGYRSLPGGTVEIVEPEAVVIRRIFADYVAGVSPRVIAGRLNREGVSGPRGGLWSHSSICGSRQRANGILHTELYAGVKVWNRMEVRKDPRTGKRTPRMRPEAEWQRTQVPHLTIVDTDTWQTTRALKLEAAAAAPFERRRTPPGSSRGS
jgi:DNA invertase Pin-like site-specific DNA recombinase